MVRIRKSQEEWKQVLSDEQYRILRLKDTERAFSGTYVDEKRRGAYRCAGCGAVLFTSQDKYDSGSGWPSFTRPIDDACIERIDDTGMFMRRTETVCARCGGHLGHVFNDGPSPRGERFCINSGSLSFHPEHEASRKEDR